MNEKKLFLIFGRRIQELRKRKGWSQERLAEAIGRTRDAVSNMERGVNGTHIKIAYAIAEALNVPLAELFEQAGTQSVDRERRQNINRVVSLLLDRDSQTLLRIHKLIEVALEISPGSRPGARKKSS